jgi:hypothetical protein
MPFKTKRLSPDREINNLNALEVVNRYWNPDVPSTAIPAGSVVFVDGLDGIKLRVTRAGSTHAAANGMLLIAEHELREGGRCTSGWKLVDLDTSAAAINDPVYLGGNGTVALSGTVVIGYVQTVATDGKALLVPRLVA